MSSTRTRPLLVSMTSRFSAATARHSLAGTVVSGVGGGGGDGVAGSCATTGAAERIRAAAMAAGVSLMWSSPPRVGSAAGGLNRRLDVANVEAGAAFGLHAGGVVREGRAGRRHHPGDRPLA